MIEYIENICRYKYTEKRNSKIHTEMVIHIQTRLADWRKDNSTWLNFVHYVEIVKMLRNTSMV